MYSLTTQHQAVAVAFRGQTAANMCGQMCNNWMSLVACCMYYVCQLLTIIKETITRTYHVVRNAKCTNSRSTWKSTQQDKTSL